MGGYLPIKDRPSALNPTTGFFATANQNVTPENYTRWDAIGYTWSDAYRGDRINNVLSTNNKIDLATMAALQTDYFSIPASKLVPILKDLAFKDSTLMNAKNRLSNWDFVLDKNSVAAGIYVAWEKEIASLFTSQFIPATVKNYISFQVTSIVQGIAHPTDYFGEDAVEKRDQLLINALEKAVASLSKKLGSNMEDWVYGQSKYKHVKLTHPLNTFLSNELKKQMNTGLLPRGGNGQTPGSTGSADNQGSGASFRLLVDTKDWDNTLMINSPGQSGNPASPFYKNLFETWANDQFFPAYYSKDRIRTVTKEQLNLLPL